MNAELLYTSAPQGLKQGSRGFCTVLSTVGMPLNLATKLESLSGYRHLYPSGTPDASKNPVGFSHLRFMVGGRQISVLSRISDYGLDYSQRTNKLAHHIVVDAPMPACGPAALLAEPGVMRDHWDGQCANIPSPTALPNLSSEPRICRKWEAITGDAGWGGVVADAWLSTSSRPVFIIFAENQSNELLGLIEESIALLSPSKRWQATFGTYVTTLPPDVDCRVRCVVAGSDEARMATARGTVIDLTNNLTEASTCNTVTAARKGLTIGAEQKPTKQANNPIEELDSSEETTNQQIDFHQHHETKQKDDSDFVFRTEIATAPPTLNKRTYQSEKNIASQDVNSRNKHRKQLFLLSSVAICLLVTIGALFSFVLQPIVVNLSNLNNKSEKPFIEEEKSIKNQLSPNAAGQEILKDQNKQELEKSPVESEPEGKNKLDQSNEIKMLFEKLIPSLAVNVKIKDAKIVNNYAFAGDTLQLEVAGIENSLTDSQKNDCDKVLQFARFDWLSSIDGKSWTKINAQEGLNCKISESLVGNKVVAQVSYDNIIIDSSVIEIKKKTEPNDYVLSIKGPLAKNQTIPFAVLGESVFLSIDPDSPDSEDNKHLLDFLENTQYELHFLDINGKSLLSKDLGENGSFLLDNDFVKTLPVQVSSIQAVGKTNNGLVIESRKNLPVIFRLQANLLVDEKFTPFVSFSKNFDFDKFFACSFGNRPLTERFTIPDVIDFDSDISEQFAVLRELVNCIKEVKEGVRRLNVEFQPMLNIAKESSKSVHLLHSILVEHEKLLGNLSTPVLLINERELFVKIADVVEELYPLIDMNDSYDRGNFTESQKVEEMMRFLDLKFKEMPNESKDVTDTKKATKERQVAFVKWYRLKKLQNEVGLSNFKREFLGFRALIGRLRELREILVAKRSFQIESPVEDLAIIRMKDNSAKVGDADKIPKNPVLLKRKMPITLTFSLCDEDLSKKGGLSEGQNGLQSPRTESATIRD